MKRFFLFFYIFFFLQVNAQTPVRTVGFSTSISGAVNYSTVTAALNGLTSGTVWVAAGTYKEKEFTIPSGVTLLGGFPSSTTSLTDRIYPGVATAAQLSVLDGNYKHRVATVYGTLDGFVITKGYAYDSTSTTPLIGAGGGVLIDGGTVQNCILHDNVASTKAPAPGTIPGTFVASIGDVYCTDGTLLKPTYTLSSGSIVASWPSGTSLSGKTPQGIVFYVDNSASTGKFYIMGQNVINKQPWFNPSLDFPVANISSSTVAQADFSGREKSDSINAGFYAWHTANPSTWYEGWDNDNPVPYCLNYNTPSGTLGQWYLPAAGEMYKLWEVYPQMLACASLLGWSGVSFNKDVYWTSTENDASNVWVLNAYNYPWGSWGLGTVGKTQGGYTIPVSRKTITQ